MAFVVSSSVACGRGPPGTPTRLETPDAHTEADASVAAVAVLSPLPPEPLFTNLTVPGFPEAVVALPNGATTRRPVLIVIHGSGDRPDWNCDAWRHITSDYGFVLCPRGEYVPLESGGGDDRRYTHRGGAYFRHHIDAALSALSIRFAEYVDVEHPAVAGFSLGATEAAYLALGDPARFPRVVELEGGQDVWSAANARAFAFGGGRRVLFGCGSSWCLAGAKSAAIRVRKDALEARVVHANVGHTTDRPLQDAIMTELGWFLEGDDRWRPSP